MAQRHICPSVGVLRRSLTTEFASISNCPSRAFTSSSRRHEDQPSTPSSSASATANVDSRRARSATALKQITSLQNRRIQPGGLAKGNFPSGQMARRTPRQNTNAAPTGSEPTAETGERRTPSPRMAKFTARPTTTHGSTPPEGQMVRAPFKLRITRQSVGSVRGPNLGGRSAGRGAPRGDRGPSGRDQGPKRRERKTGEANVRQPTSLADVDISETLSDGMVHQLLRLQRLEWDRVPYEPKYATGSFAANELIHEGRELFKGNANPVKFWGPLEKQIGVVGMFGAEAHLEVRRVPDGDDAPFGKEEEEAVDEVKKEVPSVQ